MGIGNADGHLVLDLVLEQGHRHRHLALIFASLAMNHGNTKDNKFIAT